MWRATASNGDTRVYIEGDDMPGVRLYLDAGGQDPQVKLDVAREIALRLNQQNFLWKEMEHIKELADPKVKVSPEKVRVDMIRKAARRALDATSVTDEIVRDGEPHS